MHIGQWVQVAECWQVCGKGGMAEMAQHGVNKRDLPARGSIRGVRHERPRYRYNRQPQCQECNRHMGGKGKAVVRIISRQVNGARGR